MSELKRASSFAHSQNNDPVWTLFRSVSMDIYLYIFRHRQQETGQLCFKHPRRDRFGVVCVRLQELDGFEQRVLENYVDSLGAVQTIRKIITNRHKSRDNSQNHKNTKLLLEVLNEIEKKIESRMRLPHTPEKSYSGMKDVSNIRTPKRPRHSEPLDKTPKQDTPKSRKKARTSAHSSQKENKNDKGAQKAKPSIDYDDVENFDDLDEDQIKALFE